MDVETASLFFALLSLVALAGVVGLAVIGLVSWRSGGTRLVGLRDDLGRVALWLAAAVALTCTLGSLYFSEIAKFTPCKLCWYQRIAMYPLVLLLGIAAVRRDRGIRVYGLALAAIGACVSTYHTWLQAFPTSSSSFCTVDAPCTERHVWELGFVSIPFMALAGFLLIIALLWVGLGNRGAVGNDLDPDDVMNDETSDDEPPADALVGAPAPASQEPSA
ncbi:MAG: disulfide oxidoreductase [Acidimicrobiales bacterium]